MIEKYEKTNLALTDASFKTNIYSGLMMPIIRLLDNLLYAIIVTVGAVLKIKSWGLIGEFNR